MQPPASSLPPSPGSFGPGAGVQAMAPPRPPVVLEGSSLHTGNYSFNGNVQPRQTDQSHRTNVRPDGTQEMGSKTSAPAFIQSISQAGNPNPSPNIPMWMPTAPTFQVPTGLPRTPSLPDTPGISSSVPSPSTSTALSVDSTAYLQTFMPNAPVFPNPQTQHNTVAMYPSMSPQSPSPGPWLHPQQISAFARPSFSPYAAVVPGPYPVSSHGMPPISVSFPDIQPPGVSPEVSAVGAPTASFAAGGQSSVSSGQAELPPGIDNSERNAETKDIAFTKEQLDAWTAHRTEKGTVYYYNALTGESTYEKPSGFKWESDKAAVQLTPVSWEKLTGTDWTLVTTNNAKKYYYNTTTQLSCWQVPSELVELRKKQDADALKAQSVPVLVPNTIAVTEKGSGPVSLSIPAANTGGRDAAAVRPSSASFSSSALDLIKKKLQDSGIPDSMSQGPALSGTAALEINGSKPIDSPINDLQMENIKDKRKDTNGDGDMSNSSSSSEDEDGCPTKEECILQFKYFPTEMLKERGVAPFSKWEKELPKIVFDPRFKAIPNHSARRALFEHYVRNRAEEERKEKRAAQKAALEDFKQLLEEANERVLPLKRSAQEKAQAERAAAVSNFKSLLEDKGDITSSSRWSKVKDCLKGDPRYKSVRHDDREKLFNECVSQLKAAEEETFRKAKAKQDEEEKLKERERALRKRKEREEQEVERVRQKARRKEAIESYQALLVETIKDPQIVKHQSAELLQTLRLSSLSQSAESPYGHCSYDHHFLFNGEVTLLENGNVESVEAIYFVYLASWTESKSKLEKDPQGRAANPHLDKFDLEKLFREHVKTLHE
ncbi:hypothetical protein OROGR_015735 [Orobanche gracilis]